MHLIPMKYAQMTVWQGMDAQEIGEKELSI